MDLTFLITGGSGGIGRACAQLLTAAGGRVVLVGRDAGRLADAAQTLPSERVLTVQADVTRPDEVERMMARATEWSPRLDVLVNNVGAALTGRVEDFGLEQWQRLIETNLTSVFLSCRAIIPHMRRQGGGQIITLASVAGKQAFPEWAPYCATKFALVGFSRAMQEEVRSDGIRVTLLYPGSVDTPLWEAFPNSFDRARMLRPEDVAEAVLYTARQPRHLVVDELSLIYAGGVQ